MFISASIFTKHSRGRRPMMQLPARYDHVGSFLRPKYLLEARAQKARGDITPQQLREVEDKAIAEIVKFQQDVGLKSVTDGEFRRTYFHIDFLEQLGGVKTDIPVTIKKRSEEHTSELQSRRDLVCRLLLEKKKKNKSTQERR